MELQKFLLDALKERFKSNATVEAIMQKICRVAERNTLEKYKDTPLFRNKMEFELIGVKASLYIFSESVDLEKVDLRLAYFCKSKLPKDKREKLEEVKKRYQKEKYLDSNNFKIPIWETLSYSVEIEKILTKNINLRIE